MTSNREPRVPNVSSDAKDTAYGFVVTVQDTGHDLPGVGPDVIDLQLFPTPNGYGVKAWYTDEDGDRHTEGHEFFLADTYTLDITVLNSNGILGYSYYANSLQEYAEFRGIESWTDDIGNYHPERRPDGEKGPLKLAVDAFREHKDDAEGANWDTSSDVFDDLHHKMHLKVGEVEVSPGGDIRNVKVFGKHDIRPPEVDRARDD